MILDPLKGIDRLFDLLRGSISLKEMVLKEVLRGIG